jgi:hypothetical protein
MPQGETSGLGGNVAKDDLVVVDREASAFSGKPPCKENTNAHSQKHRQAPLLYNDLTPQSWQGAPEQITRPPWRYPMLSLPL